MNQRIKYGFAFVSALGLAFALSAFAIMNTGGDQNSNNNNGYTDEQMQQKKQYYLQQQQQQQEQKMTHMEKKIENTVNQLENFDLKNFNKGDFEQQSKVPSSLGINPDGQVRLTSGKVTSVGSGSIVVKIWGLSFTVNITSDTKIQSYKGNSANLADVHVDDAVDVLGMTGEDTPGVIQAKIVRDRTLVNTANNEEVSKLQAKIQELIRILQDLLQRSGQQLPPGISPVPSPSPIPSPSPTPVPTPSPSPTPIPTPTPSPSPSPTPVPSPTPTPTPH